VVVTVWVCATCGAVLPHHRGFISAVCDGCGGTQAVTQGEYEMTPSGEVKACIDGDGVVFAGDAETFGTEAWMRADGMVYVEDNR